MFIAPSFSNQKDFDEVCSPVLLALKEGEHIKITSKDDMWIPVTAPRQVAKNRLNYSFLPLKKERFKCRFNPFGKPNDIQFQQVSEFMLDLFKKNSSFLKVHVDLIDALAWRWRSKSLTVSNEIKKLLEQIIGKQCDFNGIRSAINEYKDCVKRDREKADLLLKQVEEERSNIRKDLKIELETAQAELVKVAASKKQIIDDAQEGVLRACASIQMTTNLGTQLRHDDASMDCTIECANGETTHAHSLVLNTKEYFFTKRNFISSKKLNDESSQLNSKKRKRTTSEDRALINKANDASNIDLTSFSKDTVDLFLDYLYLGTVSTISIQKMIDLIDLADFLCSEELQKECVDKLRLILIEKPRLSLNCVKQMVGHPVLLDFFTEEFIKFAIWGQDILKEIPDQDLAPLFSFFDFQYNSTQIVQKTSKKKKDKDLEENLKESSSITEENQTKRKSIFATALGIMHATGLCVEKDIVKAQGYCQIGAEENYPPAITVLGLIVDDDDEKKYKLFVRAAKSGFAPALTAKAESLNEGIRVKQNMKQAKQICTWAANKGYPPAINLLGTIFFANTGDKKLANSYYKRAAERGSIEAMYNLSENLWEEDPDEAIKWATKAADAGCSKARELLQRILD